MSDSNSIHFGDGVLDKAKSDVNDRTKGLVGIAINAFFDYLEEKVKNLPEAIAHLRNDPDTEQKIAVLWSEYLYEKGLVPRGYSGLSDSLLISNFRQEGYMDGLYVGYVLAMMALVDNDAPKELAFAVRDYIRPNLIGHYYNDRDEFFTQYKKDKYHWIETLEKEKEKE